MATSNSYGWVSPLLSGIANFYGASHGAGNVAQGENNAIGTEAQLEGQLGGIFGPQTTQGNAAMGTLGAQLGLNGTPDYSAFENSPGFKFATQMGTQAINRQAAAEGNLYTPNTLDAVGGYVQGMASQNYNNYIQQLMQMAGIGAQGNANYASDLSSAAGNIGQLQVGKGSAAGAGTVGTSSAVGQIAGAVPWGNLISDVGSWFKGSNNSGVSQSSGAGTSGYDPYAGFDTSNLGNLDLSLTGNGSNFNSSGVDTSNLGNLDYSLPSNYPSGGF